MNKFTFTILIAAFFLFNAGNTQAQDVIDLTGMANDTILLDTIHALPEGGTILLGPGETYMLDNSYELDKSIEIKSSNPYSGEKPILLAYKNFKLADGANIGSLVLNGLKIKGEADLKDYILNIDSDNTVGEIKVKNCDVSSLRGLLRAKGGTGTLEKYTILNCRIDSIGGYGLITMDKDEKWVCNTILVKNSTVKKAEDFLVSESTVQSVSVENCTLDQLPEAGEPLFKWKGAEGQRDVVNGITIKNVVISHAWNKDGEDYVTIDAFGGLEATAWNIENCYATNEYTNDTLSAIPGFPTAVYAGTADDLWTDRANYDYTFKDQAFAGNGNAGDPRWAPYSNIIDLTGMANDTILLDTIHALPEGGTILLGPGETYTLDNSYELDKSVEITSSDPGAAEKPILLAYKNFKLADGANIGSLVFKGLIIEGEEDLKDYILNIDSDNTVGEIKVEDCEVSSLRGLLRAKGGTGTLDKYTILNCMVENIGGYGLVTMDKDEKWVCNTILVRNSTVKKAEDFLVSESTVQNVTVENCTLDQLPEAGEPLFKWKGAEGQRDVVNGITIKNVIISHAWNKDGEDYVTIDAFGGLEATAWNIENCYATNEYTNDTLSAIPGFPTAVYAGTADDLWTNRVNYDYTFKDQAFAGIDNAGDPRWSDTWTNAEWLPIETDFEIYPNPARNQLYIKVSEPTTMAIFNLAGNMLIQRNVISTRESIDISELPTGLYIVRTMDGTGKAKKLIVQ